MTEIQITVDLGNKSKNPAKQLEKFDQALSEYLERDLSKQLIGEFEKTTANWKSPPEFRSNYSRARQVSTVGPYGRGKQKWRWVSEGTPRRTITAKKPNGMMRFPRNYTPKTFIQYWEDY